MEYMEYVEMGMAVFADPIESARPIGPSLAGNQ